MDMGVDTGVEQMTLTRDFLLSSSVESAFCAGKVLTLDELFYDQGAIVRDFSHDTDILKSSEGIVY